MERIKVGLFFLFFLPFILFSQQNLLPISSYFKDKLFSPFNATSFSNGSFLPVCESEINLNAKLADSSKQYYFFSTALIKKHLVEIKGPDYYLTISPTVEISYGEDKGDTIPSRKFQNTRGFHIEGDLFKNFSFSTSFYENQARYTNYERAYYISLGEFYPQYLGYASQNAVIPGAGRTKPFKGDGFDFAYAIGNVVYSPSKKIKVITGNNSHFIGSGYRSLLLSDNSINAPYLQTNIKISQKWTFIYMRERLMNLMRRPFTTSDESYYEPKALSTNYLTYQASKKLNISVFEGAIWSKGDSIKSTKVNPLFYNPIPGISEIFVTNKNTMSSLIGINSEYLFTAKHRIYSQIAMSNFDTKNIGFQLGYRGYNFVNLKNFLLQLEYNYVPSQLYASSNRRLNYSHYNLPLAHTKGNGFQEFIIRSNYEYQRFYIDVKIIIYKLEAFKSGSILAVNKNSAPHSGQLQHEQIEVGYRFNRKMNLTLFGSYTYRSDDSSSSSITKFFNIGIRTGLINHYNDF